jgi:hypothetical protein
MAEYSDTQTGSQTSKPKGVTTAPDPKKPGQGGKPKIGNGPTVKTHVPVLDTRKAILRTSLAAAQHWFERGSEALDRAKSDSARRTVIDRTVEHALPYLEEALLTLPKHDKAYQTESIVAQMDDTTRAGIMFWTAMLKGENEPAWPLMVADTKLRDALQLLRQPPQAFDGAQKRTNKSDDVLEGNALEPVLDLIRMKSDEVYQKLHSNGDRFKLVWPYVSAIELHCKHAEHLVQEYTSKDEARRFAGKIEAATISIFRVQHWVDAQPLQARDAAAKVLDQLDPGNVDYTAALEKLADVANGLRGTVNLKAIPKTAPRANARNQQHPSSSKPGSGRLSMPEPAAGKAPADSHQDVSDNELNAETQVEQGARIAVIQEYQRAVDSGFKAVEIGMNRGIRALSSPEKDPPSSAWKDFVSLGAGLAVAGAGGFMAAWLGKTIAKNLVGKENPRVEGAIEETIQDAAVRALSPTDSTTRSSIPGIREAFLQAAEEQFLARQTTFNRGWAELTSRLYRMSSGRVASYSAATIADQKALIDSSARETMIAWTNFLARAMHGAMAADPWNHERGHIPLRGAKHEVEARSANVDPKQMDWALTDTQRPQQQEHFGLLEIHLWLDGRLVDLPGYRMRLDNVGPEIRRNFQQAGLVRNLPVNKVVRFYDRRERLSSPKPVLGNSLLIAADGFVRRGLWTGGEDRIRDIAEKVQAMSLQHLRI